MHAQCKKCDPEKPPQNRRLDPLLPWLAVLILSRQWLPQRVPYPIGRGGLADMPWRPPQRSQTTCKPTRGVDAQHRHPQPQSTCVTVSSLCGALWAFVVNPTLVCLSHRRTGTDDNHHQPATFRRHRTPRPTRLRLVESRFVPPTGREAGCGRSIFRSTVGRYSRHRAYQPAGAGAGAGSAHSPGLE